MMNKKKVNKKPGYNLIYDTSKLSGREESTLKNMTNLTCQKVLMFRSQGRKKGLKKAY